jgi:hypothetical protein
MFPSSVHVISQVINFSQPAIISLELEKDGKEFFVYPLIKIQPLKNKCKFFSDVPDLWFNKRNTELAEDFLKDWDLVEVSITENLPQGVVLYYGLYSYYLPHINFSTDSLPISKKKLSLNFVQNSKLREFESDKAVMFLLIRSIVFFGRNKTEWSIVVSPEEFTNLYQNLLKKLLDNETINFFKDILNVNNVLYVHDDEMKRRLNYIKSMDSSSLDGLFKGVQFEEQMNKLSMYTSRKLKDVLQPLSIETYLMADKEHQCVCIEGNVYIVKKHRTELEARQWLDNDRLNAIKDTTFSRIDRIGYPNVKHQFYLALYRNLRDYIKELIEDVDGYKISLLQHINSIYVIIPIFIPYILRKSSYIQTNVNIVDVVTYGERTLYWSIEDKLYDENNRGVASPTGISSIILEEEYTAILTVHGGVWIGTKQTNLKNIVKLVGGKSIYALSNTNELYIAEAEDYNTFRHLLSKVANVWSFERSAIFMMDETILVLGNNVNGRLDNENSEFIEKLTQSSSINYRPWKTFVGNDDLCFGLTYRGDVCGFGKNVPKQIKFKIKVLQISLYEKKLYAWSKEEAYVWTKEKIEKLPGKYVQIISDNIKLTKDG